MSTHTEETVIGRMETKWVHGVCPTHGQFSAMSVKTPSGWVGGLCDQCINAESEASRKTFVQENVDRRRESSRRQRKAMAGIPAEFAKCSFDDYRIENEEQMANLEVCKRFSEDWISGANRRDWLVLAGNVGNGKTHLAAAIINDIIERSPEGTARYMSASSVLRTLRSGPYGSEQSILDELSSFPGLMVMDDLGWQQGNDADRLAVAEVIAGRYAEGKPLIIITNADLKSVSRFVGEQAFDRMRQRAMFVSFTGESHRRRQVE